MGKTQDERGPGWVSPDMETLGRFWSKVDTAGPCWLWTGGTNHGYGQFRLDRSTRYVHRISYAWLVGPIPKGLVIDHLCRVRNCVNPDHLEPVTERVNILRGEAPAAQNAVATRCRHGHELAGHNLLRNKGKRNCRTCRNNRSREWARRSRASQRLAA